MGYLLVICLCLGLLPDSKVYVRVTKRIVRLMSELLTC